MHGGNHDRCERARQWASLRVDGELHAVERRLLADHLAGCAECAAFVRELEGTTGLLRAAPAEPPPARPRARSFRTSRARSLRVAALGLAAAALGVTTAGQLGGGRTGAGANAPPHVAPDDPVADMVAVTYARRRRLLAQTPHFATRTRSLQLT